jgi:hypothetical protein
MTEPLIEITDGVAWYYERGQDEPTKHEGNIQIYENWIWLKPGIWVPRENIDQIHEA